MVVEEADPWSLSKVHTEHVATFGMAALKRLDFIVDGKRGVAYLRAKKTPAPPPPFEHNSGALVFVPRDPPSDGLVACVLAGSSAYEAGVRSGDVLLKIDDREIETWRTEPGEKWRINPGNPFIGASTNSPPGTRVELTLKRSENVLKANVELEGVSIFAPPTDAPPARAK